MENEAFLGIYSKICEMILTPEFNEHQQSLFEQYKGAFSEEDENTHETKQIHEIYIEAIEKYLHYYMETFYDEQEINAFYKDFALNCMPYLKINEDAYTVMKMIIDFQEFKR